MPCKALVMGFMGIPSNPPRPIISIVQWETETRSQIIFITLFSGKYTCTSLSKQTEQKC